MFGFAEVDAAEVAFGEHHAFCAQPAEVFVAEIPAVELAVHPMPQRGQLPVRLARAYSLTAISASVADLRLRASMLITGMCAGSVSA